jgi:hypothetical protein
MIISKRPRQDLHLHPSVSQPRQQDKLPCRRLRARAGFGLHNGRTTAVYPRAPAFVPNTSHEPTSASASPSCTASSPRTASRVDIYPSDSVRSSYRVAAAAKLGQTGADPRLPTTPAPSACWPSTKSPSNVWPPTGAVINNPAAPSQ